jgi:hypothetical protein
VLSQLESTSSPTDSAVESRLRGVSVMCLARKLTCLRLPANNTSVEGRFTSSMKDLFSGMEQNGAAVAPLALLTQLRVLAPQFAEVDERSGGFAQQGKSWNRHS